MHRVWFLGVLGLPTVAAAVDVDPFDPSASIAHGSGTPAVDSPALTDGGLSLGVTGVVAEDLVAFVDADGTRSVLVPHAFQTTLYGGWTFEDKLRLEVLAPIYGHTRTATDDPFRGAALGDILLQANIRLRQNESGTFGVSLLPTLGLPTGRPKALLARGPHLKLRGAVGGEVADRFGYAANLGFVLGPGDLFEDVAVGSAVLAGAGAWVRLDDRFRVGADYDLSIGTSNAPGDTNVLSATHLFAQVVDDSGLGLMVSGGRGLIRGVGAPDWRVMAAITFSRMSRDTDGDSIVDDEDTCPLDPEDFDGFEDLDGCPDPDNDADTLLDIDDDCPLEPEDFDGWEDLDGCPDPDNDGDTLLDPEDTCPYRAGPVELDGCPDTDGDGLVDDQDRCPLDPGPEDLVGCPDSDEDQVADYRDACPDQPRAADEPPEQSNGCPTRAFVQGDRIQITERVLFETARAVIRAESYELLNEVVRALKRYERIEKVEVAGHTDNKGSDRYNLRLSQQRARSVRDYLVEQGVDPDRLVSKGYGETEPIDSNFTESGRTRNRRVEFRILEQETVEEVEVNLAEDVGAITVTLPEDRPFAELRVDGTLASPRAPVRGLIVEPGTHEIRVTDPLRSLDWSTTVEVDGGETVTVSVPPEQVGPVQEGIILPSLDAGFDTGESGPDGAPAPVDDDAPLALPVDDGAPADPTPEADPAEAGTPDPADEASTAPTVPDTGEDAPDDDGMPRLSTGTEDAPTEPAPTEPAPDAAAPAGSPDDPWGAGDPDAFPVGSGPKVEATDPEGPADPDPDGGSPGFGEAAPDTVAGPGFGTPEDELSPRERRRAERRARREARKAEKARRKAEKEAEKQADDEPPPLVDPSTLPGAEGPGGEPAPDTEGAGEADDDPWSQDD